MVFGNDYAAVYDLVYRDKDYRRECDVITARATAVGVELGSVVDLGCGTGGHALELARRGVEVVGVDLSAPMIDRARERAFDLAVDPAPVFVVGDLRTVDLGRRFDAALMMFAVLGYQLENEDVLAALSTARRHLEPGGLLFCDVWYWTCGPCSAARQPPEDGTGGRMHGSSELALRPRRCAPGVQRVVRASRRRRQRRPRVRRTAPNALLLSEGTRACAHRERLFATRAPFIRRSSRSGRRVHLERARGGTRRGDQLTSRDTRGRGELGLLRPQQPTMGQQADGLGTAPHQA